jgi:hypothetical protein
MTQEQNIIFHEEQKFSSYFILPAILIMAFAVGASGFSLRELIYEQKVTNPVPIIVLLIAGVFVPIAIALLFLSLKLQTEVRPDGLYFRFFPIHKKYHKFDPEQISEYYTRKYRPLREYGGWGIRYGFKAGKAYNVSGNQGLQLVLKNGNKVLLGTQRPEQLSEALSKIFQ